jgi:quinone-modifying oxidoreductase subunit QmoA
MSQTSEKPSRVLVIGGGFSGLTAAIEAAETGAQVTIVEKNPSLGGRVAQLNKYFPKLCPPACGLEINYRRIRENANITFHTMAEVQSVTGGPGNYTVTVKLNPRYVNDKCVACGACGEACTAMKPNDFNFGMDMIKAAYLPHSQAFPQRYVIDKTACSGNCGAACKEACKYDAIDMEMQPQTETFTVDAIVNATGWNPYDPAKIETLSYGSVRNVITNMMMERLAAPGGPTDGQILRPSDRKPVKNIAFVQCAGSRDENNLPFCSYICCMASLKQTLYLREQNPESKVTIYYIDMRTPGRYEKFFQQVQQDQNVTFVKGKVAKLEQASGSDDVIVTAEDMYSGGKTHVPFDMVVLATGMEPSGATAKVPGINYSVEGFGISEGSVFATGCAKNPLDVAKSVQDATGAALKSILAGKGR